MSEKNKISRREFLSYSAMAGAIGALGVTPLLSACSDDKGGKNAALRDAGSVYIPELPDKAVDSGFPAGSDTFSLILKLSR